MLVTWASRPVADIDQSVKLEPMAIARFEDKKLDVMWIPSGQKLVRTS